MSIIRTGKIHLGDAELSVWEEKVDEMEFKKAVFKRIIQQLNRLGWTLSIPQEKADSYSPNFARKFRYCVKGDLKADLSISGRAIELKFFQNLNAPDRPDHEGRYQYNKEKHMPYLMLLEMRRTRNVIVKYLTNIFTGYAVDIEHARSKMRSVPGELTALEWVNQQYKESWHFKGDLTKYKISDCNRKSAEGKPLEHGQRVYYFDWHGRIQTGIAYYNINNMWWVVSGKYGRSNEACHSLYTELPQNFRIKRNDRLRRKRLESMLSKAVEKMDFLRAHQLKGLLFSPDEQLYRVFHKEHQLYHCSGFSGYTKDPNYAGKFTIEECKRFGNNHQNLIEPISSDEVAA